MKLEQPDRKQRRRVGEGEREREREKFLPFGKNISLKFSAIYYSSSVLTHRNFHYRSPFSTLYVSTDSI